MNKTNPRTQVTEARAKFDQLVVAGQTCDADVVKLEHELADLRKRRGVRRSRRHPPARLRKESGTRPAGIRHSSEIGRGT